MSDPVSDELRRQARERNERLHREWKHSLRLQLIANAAIILTSIFIGFGAFTLILLLAVNGAFAVKSRIPRGR